MRCTRPSSQAILAAAKAPALLLTNLTNIRYLSGVQMSAGFMLILPRRAFLYADGRYFEKAEATARHCTVKPADALKKDLLKLRSCAFEAENVTIARLQRLEKAFSKLRFIPRNDIVESFRRSKSGDELHCIKKACAITLRILKSVPASLKPGVTESDVAWIIAGLARKAGADGMAFETIVGFAEHTALPHHRPTDRRLKKGDIVQVDMGVIYKGYCSDYSRVFFTADPTPDQKKALRALKEAKKSAEELVRVGASVRSLDQAARAVLKTHGYGPEFSHSLGHGVGLDIHEGVTISSKAKDTKLLKNEVITIEPGLYFAGKWGMRIEDTIVVKARNSKH